MAYDRTTPRRKRPTSKRKVLPAVTPLDRQEPDRKDGATPVNAWADVRWEKVRSIRNDLAEGCYDEESRLEQLLGSLARALGPPAAPRDRD